MSQSAAELGGAAPPDLLSDVLAGLQLRTAVLAPFDLTAPWGMEVEPFGPGFFYAVIEGGAYVELDGEEPVWTQAGDVFLLPAGDTVRLRSAPDVRAVNVDEIFPEEQERWTPGSRLEAPIIIRYGGGGAPTKLLAVLLDFADQDRNPLGLNLPRFILLKREDNRISPWLAPAARSILEEAAHGRLGYLAMATRMAELLFINTIRTHLILRPQDASGWLRGAADPRIARALGAIHRNPGEQWTVGRLAEVAGMSRSAFAERFQHLVGQTPFDYVTQWRMRLARDWIIQGRRTVKAAAHELGYASEKAFSHAFRRTMGAPPASYRRRS